MVESKATSHNYGIRLDHKASEEWRNARHKTHWSSPLCEYHTSWREARGMKGPSNTFRRLKYITLISLKPLFGATPRRRKALRIPCSFGLSKPMNFFALPLGLLLETSSPSRKRQESQPNLSINTECLTEFSPQNIWITKGSAYKHKE